MLGDDVQAVFAVIGAIASGFTIIGGLALAVRWVWPRTPWKLEKRSTDTDAQLTVEERWARDVAALKAEENEARETLKRITKRFENLAGLVGNPVPSEDENEKG